MESCSPVIAALGLRQSRPFTMPHHLAWSATDCFLFGLVFRNTAKLGVQDAFGGLDDPIQQDAFLRGICVRFSSMRFHHRPANADNASNLWEFLDFAFKSYHTYKDLPSFRRLTRHLIAKIPDYPIREVIFSHSPEELCGLLAATKPVIPFRDISGLVRSQLHKIQPHLTTLLPYVAKRGRCHIPKLHKTAGMPMHELVGNCVSTKT